MTNDYVDSPSDEPAPSAQPSSTMDGPLTLIVHAGNGTWHAISALQLVGLTTEEYEELDAGDESLLADLPSLSVLDALQQQFPDLADDIWS